MRLTKQQAQIALGRCNGDITQAAKSLGTTYGKLHYQIKKHNLGFIYSKPRINCGNLQELYNDCGSLSGVAKELGVSKEGVRCSMRRNSMIVSPLIKNSLDHTFFAYDNEKSFYWAGFFAADGFVQHRGNRYEVQIALARKDRKQLENLKSDLNFSGKISDGVVRNSIRNSKWRDSLKSEIHIESKQMFDDLGRFNIIPRKTHVYIFPEWLIMHPLVHHYMRGYFDGDGSFYFNKNQEYFSLRGTSMFLETYRSILEHNCDLPIRKKAIRVNSGIGTLEYGGNKVLLKIRSFLFKDATVCLERKW